MDNSEHLIEELCKLARTNLVYLTYGEWDGSPRTLDDLDISELLRMQFILDSLIHEKLFEQR